MDGTSVVRRAFCPSAPVAGSLNSVESRAPRWPASARKLGVLLLLLVPPCLLYFGRLRAPLLQPEDAYYAEVSREMAVAGSWLVPLHRGLPYFEKPPLFFWLIRCAYAIFGVHDWAARLVPCAAALATILITYWWGKRLFGVRAGLAAAWILCLSPRFVHQGRMVMMDGLLAFCILSALALGQQAIQSGRLRWSYWLLSAAACALGLLTKGPVTLVLVVVPLLVYQLMDRRTFRRTGGAWLAYLAAAIGLASPWFAVMAWRYPGFLREFFWTHHVVMRFVQPLHPEPVWYYLPVLLLGMLPGTLLLPPLVQNLFRRGDSTGPRVPPELIFVLVCCLWCLVFYSAATCKRIGYIVPAMPPLALALGYTLNQQLLGQGVRAKHLTPTRLWMGCGVATFCLLLLAVHFVLPWYYHKFSMRAQVRATANASSRAEIPVACYPHPWDSVGFYLGRQDARVYGPNERDRLVADLGETPQTVLFVKTGPVLNDFVRRLPTALEFVVSSQGEIATAGIVRHKR